MRILHIDTERWDSGLTDYAISLAKTQKKEGHAIKFWGLAGKYPYEKALSEGLETADCSGWPLKLPSLFKAVAAFGPDIIDAHTGAGHSLAVIAAKTVKKSPAVIRTKADARGFNRNLLSGLVWGNTDGLIAANKITAAEFAKLYPGIPVKLVYQGAPDLADAARMKHLGDFEFIIGMLARFDPIKGHICALESAAAVLHEFPKTLFCFAGAEASIKTSRLTDYAAKLGISGNVRFYGYIPDSGSFMKSCSMGIVPSLGSEAVSRVTAEWMSAGIPVAASAVGCIPELVENGATGLLVDPGDPVRLADAVIRLMRDRANLNIISLAARRRYEQLLTLKKMADYTEQFYERTLHDISS